MKKYLSELTGTFALVFCGTGAVIIDQQTGGGITHVGIALTFGLIVMAMIYSIGDISGAHINPAVTIGFALAKRFPAKEILPYVTAQFLGGVLASLILRFLFPSSKDLGITTPSGSEMQSFILEIILSLLLMFVILRVTEGGKEKGLFAGIAIGSVIMLEAMFAGKITGASMNPVRSLSPAIVSGNFQHLWIYIVAPFLGAASGVGLSNLLKSD